MRFDPMTILRASSIAGLIGTLVGGGLAFQGNLHVKSGTLVVDDKRPPSIADEGSKADSSADWMKSWKAAFLPTEPAEKLADLVSSLHDVTARSALREFLESCNDEEFEDVIRYSKQFDAHPQSTAFGVVLCELAETAVDKYPDKLASILSGVPAVFHGGAELWRNLGENIGRDESLVQLVPWQNLSTAQIQEVASSTHGDIDSSSNFSREVESYLERLDRLPIPPSVRNRLKARAEADLLVKGLIGNPVDFAALARREAEQDPRLAGEILRMADHIPVEQFKDLLPTLAEVAADGDLRAAIRYWASLGEDRIESTISSLPSESPVRRLWVLERSGVDPEFARKALSLPENNDVASQIALVWSKTCPEEALAWSLGNQPESMDWNAWIGSGGKVGLLASKEYLSKLDNSISSDPGLMDRAMREVDANEGWQSLFQIAADRQGESVGDSAVKLLGDRLAMEAPLKVLDGSLGLDFSSSAVETAWRSMASSQPNEFLNLVENANPADRLDALSLGLDVLAYSEGISVAKSLVENAMRSGQTFSGTKEVVAIELGQRLFTANPQAALEWAYTLPDDAVKDRLIVSGARKWAETDPAGVSSILGGISGSRLHDEMASALCANALAEPSVLLSWADTIADGESRAAAISGIVREWALWEPEAAEAARIRLSEEHHKP